VRKIRNTFKISVGKPEGNDNIKMNLKGMGRYRPDSSGSG
jgi:hypothetical protein